LSKFIKKVLSSFEQDKETRMIKKRVFVYIRVSTTEQAEEGYSLGEQESRLIKYCEAMGWEVVKVYSDPGFSGSSIERPAIKAMLQAVEKGECDIVLVDKLDRLSRSQFDTLYLIQKVFTANDVAFVSRAEAFDTSTPFGRAMVGILAVFAELERERIKERMAEGKEGRIKEGKFKGGNSVSYGYDYNIDTGLLEINEYESMVLQEIFDMILQRIPFNSIARILNEKGYKSKTKSEWSGTVIKQIAENQTYIGKQKHKGEWLDAINDKLISDEKFAKIQDILAERDRTNERFKAGKKYNSPLGGMIWCANCNSKYHWKKWSKNKSVYVCYSRSKADKKLVKDPSCKNRFYEDKELEQAIYNEILKLKSEEFYIDNLRSSVDSTGKIEIIKKQIESINDQISKLMDLYSLGTIDIDAIKAKIKPLSEERSLLESELQIIEHEKPAVMKEDIIHLVDVFEQTLLSGDSTAIHDSIMELVDYIEIDGDNVHVHWNF